MHSKISDEEKIIINSNRSILVWMWTFFVARFTSKIDFNDNLHDYNLQSISVAQMNDVTQIWWSLKKMECERGRSSEMAVWLQL